MAETNPAGSLGDMVNDALPRIVKIRPGSSSERELMAVLPKELATATVKDVLDYVKSDPGLNRKDERTVERIKQELAGGHGITIAGQPVKATDNIGQYFQPARSPKGTPYEVAEMIVAANESGGAYQLSRFYRSAA